MPMTAHSLWQEKIASLKANCQEMIDQGRITIEERRIREVPRIITRVKEESDQV